MKVLVTGADGFVGEHVVQALLQRGHEVVGATTSREPRLRLMTPRERRSVQWRAFDLRDEGSVTRTINDVDPDGVVHLAAIASVSMSWQDPERTFQVNALGTLHLLNALRKRAEHLPRRVVLIGSGEAYGVSGTEAAPLREDLPLRPLSPYGGSKAAQEMIGWSLARSPGLDLVMTRSFQHAGPGQHPWYVISDWAQQLIAVGREGGAGSIKVGNTEIVRDFSDVRDAADAYSRLLEQTRVGGVLNVCSGRGYPLSGILDSLQRIIDVEVTVERDPAKYRPAEVDSLVGDPSRLREATGWTPTRSMDETLTDLVDHLRARTH